ncbi:MAG: hypothetical protein ABI629_12720 [bacterium]
MGDARLWAYYPNYYRYVSVEDWAQSGTGLTTSQGFTGIVDPTTGAFSLERYLSCDEDRFSGTVAADGLSLTGFEGFASTPFCNRPGAGLAITGSRCPSGTIEPGEGCDDGNAADGDGCDDACNVERCWTCTGTPSVCTQAAVCPTCPNAVIDAGEGCDDGNVLDGDGCDHSCAIEACWQCNDASPTYCQPGECRVCGNGAQDPYTV